MEGAVKSTFQKSMLTAKRWALPRIQIKKINLNITHSKIVLIFSLGIHKLDSLTDGICLSEEIMKQLFLF